mgnify:CR=1 FL=1
MDTCVHKRQEKNLRYNWPIWFAEDYNEMLSQGQMIEIYSMGASFTCYADKCPNHGEKITARFSVPRYGLENSFNMENFICDGSVIKVENLSPFIRRVSISFVEALPFKPGEVEDTEALAVDEKIGRTEKIIQKEAAAMAEGLTPQTQHILESV